MPLSTFCANTPASEMLAQLTHSYQVFEPSVTAFMISMWPSPRPAPALVLRVPVKLGWPSVTVTDSPAADWLAAAPVAVTVPLATTAVKDTGDNVAVPHAGSA